MGAEAARAGSWPRQFWAQDFGGNWSAEWDVQSLEHGETTREGLGWAADCGQGVILAATARGWGEEAGHEKD